MEPEFNLIFCASDGSERSLGTVKNPQDAWLLISRFLEQHKYTSYYQRYWTDERGLWIDVGSHTEFFVLERWFDGPQLKAQED